MVVPEAIHNIMGGIENTGDIRLHNHRRKLKQRFDIVKKLGQGTYGKVQLGINKETGQEVAIKTIRKSKIETEADLIRIRREIQIMSSVRHPNIIHIYEVFENREKMVLVMEYAAGGELYDYLSERKVLTEDEARRIFRQIATAVFYCHKHNICHRDLKLENILLDEVGNAKIADFGLSNVFTYSSLLSTFCGSPLYASPEIVKGTPYHGPEVDCWSLGVLLYTLVYGAMPFDGSNFKRLVKQISQGNYFEPKTPSSASTLISEMLNVNPARRADIITICSHRWMNETYSETCLNLAEELAIQTPVRLDLLLSLSAPPVAIQNAVVGADQNVSNENDEVNGSLSRPVRSQSLGSILPVIAPPSLLHAPVPELKEIVPEEKKPQPRKKERSHSKTRRKDRSSSRPRKSHCQESQKPEAKSKDSISVAKQAATPAPLINSGTQVISKPESRAQTENNVEMVPKEESKESKMKPVERRRSKVFEVAEKFNSNVDKLVTKVAAPKKVILPAISVEDTRKELERRASLAGSASPPKKNSICEANSTPDDEPFPLASTVALNKLVESAFRDEKPFDVTPSTVSSVSETSVKGDTEKITPKVLSPAAKGDTNKAATLPRRKTVRAEIQLVTPQYPPDKYKTEVEHYIPKPNTNHKTEVVFPIAAPLPPKPLTKQENQSKEHIIPIQIEQEFPRKTASPPSSWTASKSSIPRTSSSSLSRQSTVESDSGSTISTGEPIRKSPREVIIPIAVEGGGYVTPSDQTLTRISSVNDSEDEGRSNNNNSRCFTLRSTKRRRPERNQSAQLDTADSLSSDEDDNFQLLTPENLFSTLLSRVQSLTRRWNNDQMRRSTAFPQSLFAQHSSLFDSMPKNRLTETRSFNRAENAPWRRNLASNQPQRDDSMKKRYSYIFEEKSQLLQHSASKVGTIDEIATTTTAMPKTNIEEEFDEFFSKYKTSNSDSYKRPLSSLPGRISRSPFVRKSSPERQPQIQQPNAKLKSKPADQISTKPPRKSRFLRPDFYDTPREESKYVIHNEHVRAFRERSLSRQRDLSRNRSTDSFSSNGCGAGATDYARSKTCSISDRLDQLHTRDYRRTFSEDTPSMDQNDTDQHSVAENTGSSFQNSKRKSLILQNELENQIRKTQNINSKLSGLMVALNDNETQYEKKLKRLYGIQMDESEKTQPINEEGVQPEEKKSEEPSQVRAKVDVNDILGRNVEKAENGYDNLSLVDKKNAYFRRLVSSEEQQNVDTTSEWMATTLKASASGTSSGSPESSLVATVEEMDSDGCSGISDGAEAQYLDNMKDRIRRRSFYSRFNSYKSLPRSKPLSYSRSLSADVNKPQSSTNTKHSSRPT